MFNVDLRGFLNDKSVCSRLKVRLRTGGETDEFGIPNELSEKEIDVVGAVVEKRENGLNTTTGMFFERIVYKIYLDRRKYGMYDFNGAEIIYRGAVLNCTAYPLDREYASHFVVHATEEKVVNNDRGY